LQGIPADEAMTLRMRQSTAQAQLAQLEKQAELLAVDKTFPTPSASRRHRHSTINCVPLATRLVNSYVAIRNASPGLYPEMVGKTSSPRAWPTFRSRGWWDDDGLLLEYFLG